jgi:pimeloyl-ACP methyl ester carboxylesterase
MKHGEARRETVTWRGGTLSMLARAGRGPGLLMLHGLCGGAVHFDAAFHAKALDGHALVALDLPGFGESAGLGRCSLDEPADAARHAATALGLTRPMVVAHSMAASVAARLTGMAAGLVLLEGNVLPAHLGFSDRLLGGGEAAFRAEFPRMQATAAMILKYQTRQVAAPALRRYAETWSACEANTVWSLIAAFNPEVRAGAVSARLAAYDGPLLCLYGTEGDYATSAPELARALPNAELRAIEGAAHYLMLDAPEAVYAATAALMKRVEDHAEFAAR